jgi:hypothetical protein
MIENKGSTELQEIPNPTPDEQGGFVFSSVIKIIDPNSKEVLVHQRGDD